MVCWTDFADLQVNFSLHAQLDANVLYIFHLLLFELQASFSKIFNFKNIENDQKRLMNFSRIESVHMLFF